MPVVCPTILGETKEQYDSQVRRVADFAHRVQVDLSDGVFAPHKTLSAQEAWWPAGIKADIHLMFKQPLSAVKSLLVHKPNLIIVHAEASGAFEHVAQACQQTSVKIGIALLANTPPETIEPVLERLDHVLIFSGNLGYQGGSVADLSLLEKVKYFKNLKPDLEVGWDGGVNSQNISQLVFGGVDVLNVGGFIQYADNPAGAYETLARIADETGTT